jgi:hypothetical protein
MKPADTSLDRRALIRLSTKGRDGAYIDGIETANMSPAGRSSARKAAVLNREHLNVAEVGGSDAHFLACVASAHTEFDGVTASDIRNAILDKSTRAVNGKHPSLLQLGARQVLRQTYRGIMTTPRHQAGPDGTTSCRIFGTMRVELYRMADGSFALRLPSTPLGSG